MKKHLLYLLFTVLSVAGYAQVGSLSQSVYRSRVLDSTTVTTPTGWGLLYFNTQRTPATWVFSNDNGTTWNALGSGTGGGAGTLTSVGLTLGTSGTDAGVSGSPLTSDGSITLNLPNSSASNRGLLTSTDWSTFNGKQSAITFGTGVQTALGVNVGSAGSLVLFNGAGGTPSSITLTNGTGLPGATGITGRILESNIPAKYIIDRVSTSTAGGTITLDCNSQLYRKHTGSASFSTGKVIALSNTTNAESFTFYFSITDVSAALTFPSDWIMQDPNFNSTAWTPSQIGNFEMGGDYDGTNWSIKIKGPNQ